MNINDLKMAQGPAKPVEPDSEEERKDLEDGITKPNLHRRIDNEDTPKQEGEVAPDTYNLTVCGVNSYRTTTHTIHDEDSDSSEIP